MGFKFNPFSGNFDQTGSGGGGSSYIDGEVQNFSALPQTVGSPAVDSAYLVREAEGTWLLNRKPAGIYIRTANTGVRASDWTYAGEFPDVFNDANFLLYDNGDSTKNLQFQLSGITTGTTRTLTVPNASGTIALTSNFAAPPAIGITTPNTVAATDLSASNKLSLPSAAAASPTAGDLYRNANTIRYRDSTNTERLLLNATDNLSNLANAATARANLGLGGWATLSDGAALGTENLTISDGESLDYIQFTAGSGVIFYGNRAAQFRGALGLGTAATANLDALSDSAFRIADNGDATKKLAFELSGISTGTTRTLTVPNASGTIARTEDFASPPSIGNTTPNSGAFTTLSANNGILTASAPVLDLSQTWNNAAATFTGLTFNVTNTASASASRVFNFLVGGTSRMAMNPSGDVLVGTGITLRADGLISASLSFVCGTSVGINPNDIRMRSSFPIQWSSTSSMDGTADLFLRRDAAGTLAQYNGTNAQESRLYGTFTSSTNYQRMTIKSVRQTLSALSGASATTTGTFIPDGAVVVGVTTRVATLLTGATGYTIGDGTDADRWGDITGTAIGTTSDNRDWTAGTIECFTAGGNITLTAKTSNFTAGAIEICVFYLAGEAD